MVAPRAIVALVLAGFGIAGCTSSSSGGEAPSPSPAAGTAAAPSVDPVAARTLRQAVAATAHQHSYTFHARTTVRAKGAAHTAIKGRVVRGNGVAYRLAVGKRVSQVVRIHRDTYVRQVPGRWSRLAHPRSVANPSATLLAVLRGMTPTDVGGSPAHRVVRGALTAPAAERAGLPHDRDLAAVTVVLDRAHHVVGLV